LAFVLDDLFAVPFDEIGQILGKSTDVTTMLAGAPAGRCRRPSSRRVADGRSARWSTPSWRRLAAATSRWSLRLLDPEVRLTVDTLDGAWSSPLAPPRSLLARNCPSGQRRVGERCSSRPSRDRILARGRRRFSAIAFTIVDDRIAGIAAVTNPARLASIDLPDPG
jgi:RNA polymerase sigma-70 factor (ECF subfamily)